MIGATIKPLLTAAVLPFHPFLTDSDIPLIASIPDAITQQKLSGIQEMAVKR